MSKMLYSLPDGALIKLNENSAPTVFVKIGEDHYVESDSSSPPAGAFLTEHVTLMRRDAFNERMWETASYNQNSSYKNRYIGSQLDNFCDGEYLLKLDEEIRKVIIPVPIRVAEGNGVNTIHRIFRRGYALSCTEVGATGSYTEGAALPYFDSNEKRIACLDGTTTAVNWGLRSPDDDTLAAYRVTTSGSVSSTNVYAAQFAPRPCFNLDMYTNVSDEPDADGCYAIESIPRAYDGIYIKGAVWNRVE